ncbi:hypothetical protein BK139_07285 [Paenibacillus sp. FSL R5-0490]|nr:hypothetical protein BK139_07285 [Paenibacillus sp. FSL R5-0490]
MPDFGILSLKLGRVRTLSAVFRLSLSEVGPGSDSNSQKSSIIVRSATWVKTAPYKKKAHPLVKKKMAYLL